MSVVRILSFVLLLVLPLSGCVSMNKDVVGSLQSENDALQNQINQSQQTADELRLLVEQQRKEIAALTQQVQQLSAEKQALYGNLQTVQQNQSALAQSKLSLEDRLRKELEQYQAKLEMTEKGLVVTFLSEVLFDSGMADLKTEAYAGLQKVAEILNRELIDTNIAIEGHTDNEPITYSAWLSNWELSSARALSVLHFFIDQCQVAPTRLSANAYGEFFPKMSNDTEAGQRQNRRVEILIMPKLQRQANPL